MAYTKGTLIRVKLDASITGALAAEPSVTTLVTEAVAGTVYQHTLYLSSRAVTVSGGSVHAEFDAEVRNDSPFDSRYNSTRIQEVFSPGIFAATHYLNLDSPSITELTEVTDTGVPVEKNKENAVKDTVINQILDDASTPISGPALPVGDETKSTDIIRRIRALSNPVRTYAVIRNSTGSTVATLSSGLLARTYLDQNDLNPERFTVTAQDKSLSAAETAELSNLQALNAVGASEFDSWARGITLYRREYFSADWAEKEAAQVLNISDTGQWPLNLVNWEEAAAKRRATCYIRIESRGTSFWGSAIYQPPRDDSVIL